MALLVGLQHLPESPPRQVRNWNLCGLPRLLLPPTGQVLRGILGGGLVMGIRCGNGVGLGVRALQG